jgi:peptidoglycan/LPS O-acetylase OafA/YrhL
MFEAGDPSGATATTTISTPPSVDPVSRGPDATDRRYRGDIDGLRALAIILIVGYHVGLPGFDGGFVGVDVFFVISGYLISRNLLEESHREGRVALLRFWGRRIRRLVPALAVMIAAVLALSIPILTSLEWQAVASEARAAALYVSNIMFANQTTDYFSQGVSSSLFLHTWSLGVEEQFNVVWPLHVGAAAVATARRRSALRPALVAIFATTLAASFVLCVVLTARGSAHAFFGLPARAWEFAAAGLLAAIGVPRALERVLERPWFSTAASVVGLALIVGALVGFGEATVYPGAWPLVPVTGTMLLILAGSVRQDVAVTRTLATAPCRALGRVSYSWYLWHWPLILLAIAAFDRDDLWLTSAAALVALGVGAVVYRFLENPVRFSTRLTGSLPSTYVMGVAVTFVVLVASLGLTRYSDVELADAALASSATPTVSLADVRASRKSFSCLEQPTDANGDEYCIDGDLNGDRTVMVIGDSHARHWKPAFAQVARERGVRLVIRWRSVCTAFPIRTVVIGGNGGEDLGCPAYRQQTAALIDDLRPDAIVTANSDDYGLLVIDGDAPINQERRTAVWRAAYQEFVGSMQRDGFRVGSVVDTPRMPSDPLDCVAEKGVAACAAPAEQARNIGRDYSDAERSVRDELGGVAVLDINPVLCDDQVCPVVLGGTYVYTDLDHLYEPFVLQQVPAVEEFFDDLLG